MTELGLRASDKEEVINAVNVDDDVAERVRRIPPGIGDALLRQLRDAAMVDGVLDPREAELIEEVERLLPPPEF